MRSSRRRVISAYPQKKPEIRLRNTYVLAVTEHITDDNGDVVELKATIDPATLGNNPEGRKVKGVIHWVSADQGVCQRLRVDSTSLYLAQKIPVA